VNEESRSRLPNYKASSTDCSVDRTPKHQRNKLRQFNILIDFAMSWSAGRPTRKCISCLEHLLFEDVQAGPCEHYYCIKCLEEIVRVRLEDTGFRLPQCCRSEFGWDDIRGVINSKLAAEFDQKKQDFETTTPTYCTDQPCSGSSALIGARHVSVTDATAICPICRKVICTKCKQDNHSGACAPDATLAEVLELAKKEGWKECPRCGEMIELEGGCSHMT